MIANTDYYWEGVFQSGEKTKGLINANSIPLAKAALRKQGIITRKIVKKRNPFYSQYTRGIKPSDITLFTRQLATLIAAGIPLSQSLDILEHGLSNPRMKTLIQTIRTDVQSGLMLTQALNKHPVFFNPLFCSMINAGEQSGSLDVMLLKVAAYKEKMVSIRKKIRKALLYPMAVTLIAILVTGGLLTFVIPQFDSLFKSFGAELPVLTRYVINLSIFFKAWWPMLSSMITVIIYGSIYALKRSLHFSKMVHRLILKLPIIGSIVQKASIARFTRTLSITFAAGLPLTVALKSVAEVTGIYQYTQATYKIREEISQGLSLQKAIQNTNLFPDMVIQFISIGEESGTLEQMLNKIADFYEEDVDTTVDALSSLLEPAIMTILGLLIGILVISRYLPILKLGSVV